MPRQGATPRRSKRFGVVAMPESRCGPLDDVSVKARSLKIAIAASVFDRAAHSSAVVTGRASKDDRSLRRRRLDAEAQHAIRVGIGERAQQHGADDREDGRRRADAERERQQRDRREGRAPGEQAHGDGGVARDVGDRESVHCARFCRG